MHPFLTAVIDSLLAFGHEHSKGGMDPSDILAEDQLAKLRDLDAELYAGSQLEGVSLSIIPEPQGHLHGFGNSKMPYCLVTLHLPFKDEDGTIRREKRASGMAILLTHEWIHAMRSLRATAEALQARAGNSGKNASAPNKRSCKRRPRGRPAGSKTKEQDGKLYSSWKAAYSKNRITKREFLREKGLPESDLAAIERGRKQRQKNESPGKQ
jgi:hypothetical protein